MGFITNWFYTVKGMLSMVAEELGIEAWFKEVQR